MTPFPLTEAEGTGVLQGKAGDEKLVGVWVFAQFLLF